MNYLASILIGALTFIGGLFPHANTYDAGGHNLRLGAISFPTSLDALTNPGATDSVATVSHSAQHANANDAIEALEAKLGIGASTATNNTIFVGNGTGSSGFSTSATSTNFLATNLTTASTTMGSTSVQTLLAARATTTDLYISNLASTTEVRANKATVGMGVINNLTVTTCSGCGSAGVIPIIYIATSTTNRFFDKRLTLNAGDVVTWGCASQQNADSGVLSFRITSPWSTTTTTPLSANSSPSYAFNATTTETVEFACQDAGATASSGWTMYWAGVGYANVY